MYYPVLPSSMQRLEKVEEKQLCKLCFRHLAVNECWAKGKIPNCQAKGCGGEHNYLLHDALVLGRALVIREVGEDAGPSYSCREDIRAEVAGKTHYLHALHDWGASKTLITHDAADRAGLAPIRHAARLVTGLGGECCESTCFYVRSWTATMRSKRSRPQEWRGLPVSERPIRPMT